MKSISRFIAIALVAFLGITSLSAAEPIKVVEYTNTVNPNDPAHLSNGIIVAGKAGSVRAFSTLNLTSSSIMACASCADFYKQTLGDNINVYLMVVPSAAAYYTPNVAKSWTRSPADVLNTLYSSIKSDVKIVDVYSALAPHAKENIFLRTDHHWAPLGGYYAAKEFARVAGVPFKDISNYDAVTVPNYVGSMYNYSKDPAVKSSPEKFVYHKPRNISYTTTYINIRLGSGNVPVGENRPVQGEYFVHIPGDGAYCTFMGGDNKITQVRTSVGNGRRLLIVKDSFGNTVPGYLFYSFDEIHVVDFRYFTRNLKTYIQSNNITDVIIECNISFACSPKPMASYKRLLTK